MRYRPDSMSYLPWLALLVCLLLLAQACRVLIADVRSGYAVTMGGDGLFSGHWFLGAVAAAAAVAMFGLDWFWAVLAWVLVYLGKSPVRSLIVARYLGRDLPPPKPDGFKEFLRRTESKRD